MSHPRFGPAGNAESFRAMGYRHTIQVPEYLERMGLDAYEYQCGRGVRISQEAAAQLGEEARKRGISLSVHAPYYISLSSLEEEKREKSPAPPTEGPPPPAPPRLWGRSASWYTPAPAPRSAGRRRWSWPLGP